MKSEDGHNYTFSMLEPPWLVHNDYFHIADPHTRQWRGHKLPITWWSRCYEYPWAIRYAKPGMTVADMGCGYMWRPFAEELAKIGDEVWAIDDNTRMLDLPTPENMIRVVADFMKPMPAIPDEFFDVIFCISVLEERVSGVPLVERALPNFSRLLKPEGRIVLTFDSPHNSEKPKHELYKGIDPNWFEKMVEDAELDFDGPLHTNKVDAVFNEEFNLCVYHSVLKKR